MELVECTTENFSDAADRLEALLPTCKFVAFDEEMTGIMMANTAPHISDTPEARYAKMKRVTEEFQLMQVGLCLFHEEVADGATTLVATPFNFYVFPDAKSGGRIVMHASTAAFHRDNHMDWNKWFRQGVPYLSRADHALAAEACSVDVAKEERPPISLSRESDIAFVSNAMGMLTEWEANSATGEGAPQLVLPECNAFLRRALYERVASAHPELTLDSQDHPDNKPGERPRKLLVAMRMTEEQKAARKEERRLERLAKLDERAGFLRVWRALTASGKPVVGHNCTYDLLFLYSHFEAALPPTLLEWKAAMHALLPHVWDTKWLSTSCELYDETALGPLYAKCVLEAPPLKFRFAKGYSRYEDGGQSHEAGYDAYMTGVVYAVQQRAGRTTDDAENRLYMMRSLVSIALSKPEDVLVARDGLHLCFDAATSTADLLAALAPPPTTTTTTDSDGDGAGAGGAGGGGDTGGETAPPADAESVAPTAPTPAAPPPPAAPPYARIRWIDDTSAFALLTGGGGGDELTAAAARASAAGYTVRTLDEWLDGDAEVQLDAPPTLPPPPPAPPPAAPPPVAVPPVSKVAATGDNRVGRRTKRAAPAEAEAEEAAAGGPRRSTRQRR